MKYRRIHILGPSGCGKSYLAHKLHNILRIKTYDLDDLFFKRKYDLRRDEEERNDLLKSICKKKEWIIEGTFWRWIEPSIKKVDLVIWLDPNRNILSYRLIKRYLLRKYNFFRRKGEDRDDWNSLIELIKYSKNYKKRSKPKTGYEAHEWIIKKHNVKFVQLTNKNEIKKFLEDITKNNH